MIVVMGNSRTPMTSSEEVALNHLEQAFDATNDNEILTREDAVAYLVDQGVECTNARVHIKQLLLKGYLYEVNEELRIPPQP